MNGQQLDIKLSSPVDTETFNVIQKEPAFVKKNSIVHRGVFSNLTSQKGSGKLSTTAKKLYIDKNGIHAGDSTFSLPDDLKVVSNYERVDSFADISMSRTTNYGLYYIRKPDNVTLVLHTDKGDFTIKAESITVNGEKYEPININGFITQNEDTSTGFLYDNMILVVKSFYNGSKYYNILTVYDTEGKEVHSWEETIPHDYTALGDVFTGYVKTETDAYHTTNYIYWGFDDPDMRKRFLFRTYYYFEVLEETPVSSGDATPVVLSGDGEPVVTSKTGFVYSPEEYMPNLNEAWGFRVIVQGFGLISDEGKVHGEPLLERVAKETDKTDFARGLLNTSYNTLENGVLVVEVPFSSKKYYKPAEKTYATETMDRPTMNKGLGANPVTYLQGEQAGRNNWSIVDFTNYVEDENVKGYDYDYILSLDLNDESFQTLKALEKEDGFTYNVAHVTFFNFSDPFGVFKEKPNKDEQVFPHLRFFMNVQEERGKYWDYGKGWNCLTVDQLYINFYESFGVAVFETPLAIVYDTTKDFSKALNVSNEGSEGVFLLDALRSETTRNGLVLTTDLTKLLSTNKNYPSNSSAKFERETTFQAYVESKTVDDKTTYFSQVLRLHPITAQMFSEDDYFYSNHSWTGWGDNSSLSTIPHTYELTDDISLGVYNEVPVCLAAFKTLLFTPQDLKDNYTFDRNKEGYFITRYSKDSVESVTVKTKASWQDVDIDKVADYEFRTNVLDNKNLLVEDHAGNFTIERAFYPYIMDSKSNNIFPIDLPEDATSSASNGVWYFAAGLNFRLDADVRETSTFLLPAVTLNVYVSSENIDVFNRYALSNRNGKLEADIWCFGVGDEIDEFYTFNRATTDILYKNTKYIDTTTQIADKYQTLYSNTSWWAEDVVIYPIGIVSRVTGVDYTTPTVDAGNNYSARFFRNSNKTFLVFNQNDLVYFGDRIFTIMSGNYYFDGQGIYYLGSRDDYSQNIFTAYAIGMVFLANSSAEAYFYSPWDKSLYLYTASNTLQKSQSFADMGDIIDALYSSAEQALYILFDDNKLYVKTQADSMIIPGVQGTKLQSTALGCQVLSENGFETYNPYLYDDIEVLDVETEWLGDQDAVFKYSYIDVVLLDQTEVSTPTVTVEVDTLNGKDIKEEKRVFSVAKTDWQNHLARLRVVPKEPVGNAFKIKLSSVDSVHVFAMSVRVERASDVTSAPRNLRS